MHILFLSHYFPPEVNAPATRTYEHARRWVKETDIRVTVITNHPHHPAGVLYKGYVNKWLSKERIDGIEVLRVKSYLAPNAGFARRTVSFLFFMVAAVFASLRVSKPDVLVATSPQFFCAVAGFVASRLKACPFVFELRDIWPESIVAVGALSRSRVIGLLERVELWLYHRSTVVVAVTNAFRRNLVRRGVPPEKVRVIQNGVDLNLFRPRSAPAELARALGAEGKFVLSYIGTVGMAHAVNKIIAAADELRDFPELLFLIVGEGAKKKDIEELVSSRGIVNVKVLPGAPKEKVGDYYALTDLSLITLRNEPLFRTVIPSKIFEVMAMAKPILSTVDGECREIVQRAGCGVFAEPENVEQMASLIRKISTDRDSLREMGRKGRNFVEKHADRDALALEYLDLLRSVVIDGAARDPVD